MRVLIIEDEPRLARNVAQALEEQDSYAVDIAVDGQDGRHLALTNPYDLIILDLMLPGVDGLTILRTLRDKGRRTPVMILTARDGADEVVRGLDCGSDDYLTKPFDMAELLARVRSLIRRSHDRPSPLLTIGELAINTATREVTFHGRTARLPAMEYRLLEYLAMRQGQVVSKADIDEHLYDFGSEKASNVIEVYVSALRRRFDPGPDHKLFHTFRGQGYLLGEIKP
jgi:DNA-binding response OmpR family regulator